MGSRRKERFRMRKMRGEFLAQKKRHKTRQKNFDSFKSLKVARLAGEQKCAEFILYYSHGCGYIKVVASSKELSDHTFGKALFWNKYRRTFDFGDEHRGSSSSPCIYTGAEKGSHKYHYQKEAFPVVAVYFMENGVWVKDATV